MKNAQSSWHLLGAGSLGCLFAAYWQRAGIALELIVRDVNTLQQLHANGGITLTHANQCDTIAVTATTSNNVTAPIRQLVVCTKAQQTLAALTTIKTQLASDAIIVLLQNGMGVRELIAREFPHVTILHALSTEGGFRTQRFHVTHAGRGETLIGALEFHQQLIAEKIVRELQCELSIAAVPDITQRLWLKLAVNSVINPLTALHRCRNGALLQLDNIDTIVTQLCEELTQVARAEKINLTVELLRDEVFRVMQATAANKSSMLQDIEAGRSSEIEFINGFIVQRAHTYSLDCPQHERLLNAIRALSR